MNNEISPDRQYLEGIAAAPGLADAPAVRYCRRTFEINRHCDCDAESEMKRLHSARQEAKLELLELALKVTGEASKEEGDVFEAHAMIVDDPELTQKTDETLKQGWNAEVAWMEAIEFFADLLTCLPDPTLQARAADIRDVGQRVLGKLMECDENAAVRLTELSVIISDDLAPSETACLDKNFVAAFCTSKGGSTSHTAILAKALGIPAVVGLGDELLLVDEGTRLLVNGEAGKVVSNPNPEEVETFHQLILSSKSRTLFELSNAHKPAKTIDQHQVEFVANIGNVQDAQKALENGAEGVGLFRTEFLFLNRNIPPDEEAQYQVYKQVLEVMGSRPVVVRTLDAGGDKDIPYLDRGKEDNPFLGWRAIRICLDMPEMFKAQLRALLRAGVGHDLRIMFPMIATIEEVRRVREIINEVKRELKDQGIEIAETLQFGIMVEIPAAVVMADQLAKEVDFFSIGTNDLTQYSMAAERTNPKVAHLGDACHPAILRQIKRVIEASHHAGIWTGVCGELAGDPDAVPILLGLGLDEFSMSSFSIPRAKAIVRKWSFEDAQNLASQALEQTSAAQVRSLVQKTHSIA